MKTRSTNRVTRKVEPIRSPGKNQEKNQCATAAVVCVSPVVPKRREPEPPALTGPETAAAARRVLASLRGMGTMVPRPGSVGWVDPIDARDLGPLSDIKGAA